MREIAFNQIVEAVSKMSIDANYYLDQDAMDAYPKALGVEVSPAGKAILEQIIENARIASEGEFPLCQDTGFAVLFVELGQEVHVTGILTQRELSFGSDPGIFDDLL